MSERVAFRDSRFRGALLLAAVLGIGTAAWAAEPPASSTPAVSKEMREKMATMHEQMATCLRSDKAISECRTEMRKSCQELGPEGCPMMGSPGMHRRMPPSSSSTPKS